MLGRSCSNAFLSAVVCLPFLLLVSQVTSAAEWSAEPSVLVGREYNDNLRLTLQPHNAVNSISISPKIDLSVRKEIWQLDGAAELIRKRYSGDNSLDRDDRNFNIASSYQTERSMWRLSGYQTKASVLTDQLNNVNTGLVQVQSVQNAHSINPSWIWSMTELTQLQLGYQVTDVNYVNGSSLALYDYRSQNTTARLTRQFSSQISGLLDASYSYFRVPATGVESRSNNVQAGVTGTFSETLSGFLMGGLRRTVTIIPGGAPIYSRRYLSFGSLIIPVIVQTGVTATRRDERTSSVYSANLDKTFENMRLGIVLSRALEPSGSGGQVRTDSLNLNLERPLSEKLKAYFSVGIYGVSEDTGNVTEVDRRVYQAQPRMRWQWTPELNIDATYNYIHLKRASEDRAVSARSAYLALSHQWPKMSISR